MDPTVMNSMIIPAMKIRVKKARIPPTLNIETPVTADPGEMVREVAMPNAKKLQKISKSTAPTTIPGNQIYDEKAPVKHKKMTVKDPELKKKYEEAIEKHGLEKANKGLERMMETNRKSKEGEKKESVRFDKIKVKLELPKEEVKVVEKEEVKVVEDKPDKEAHKMKLAKALVAKELSPIHVRSHIAKLRAGHMKQLAADVAFYRAEVNHEKKELRKAIKKNKDELL